jgi:hypothetical protein
MSSFNEAKKGLFFGNKEFRLRQYLKDTVEDKGVRKQKES